MNQYYDEAIELTERGEEGKEEPSDDAQNSNSDDSKSD